MSTTKKESNISPTGDYEISFRSDWGTFANALRSLSTVGDTLYWDADEFKDSYATFHSAAFKLGIRIATKKCAKVHAYVIKRIA